MPLNPAWFDLEQAIMTCNTTSDDLDLLVEHVLEARDLDRDQLSNALLGLKELNDLRCQKAFAMYERMIALERYKS
jgi:hypothetical protein